MALFKIYRGLEANLPTEMHDGYAYFCSDSAAFFIDFLDSDGNLQRKQLNAKDAETLSGASLATILQSSEVEIPTSKAVFDALEAKQNKLTGAQGQLAGFDSNGDLIATDPKLIVDVEFDSDMTTFVSASHTYAEITDAINAGKDVYVNNVALGLLHSYIQTYDGMMYFGFFAGVTYARFAVGSDNNWLYSSENVQHKPEVFAATITDASITIDDIVSGEEFGLTTTYDYMEIMNATANDLCDVYIMVDGFSTPLKNVRIDNDPTTIVSRFEGVTRITANDESVLVYATVQVRDGIYCMCIPVSNDTFAVTAELGYSYETDRGKEYIIDSLSASFDEVYSAFTDGKNVVAYAGDYIIPLTYCYSGRAVFSTISYEGNNYHCYFYLNGAKLADPAAILYCDNIVVGQVDEAPTQYSENVIKSGAVYSALEEKQNKLTFDDVPTADSTNPITSGAVAAAIANSQADWSVNDESNPAYVKNRPVYKYENVEILFDGTITTTRNSDGYNACEIVSSKYLENGVNYTITINDISYNRTAYTIYDGIFIGNARIYGSGLQDTGEDFLIMNFGEDTPKLDIYTANEVTNINLKIETISEGTKVIDAITNSDWSINDKSDPSYVKNRTHWAERLFDIEWNGDTTNLYSANLGGGYVVYKISDLANIDLSGDEILSGIIACIDSDGVTLNSFDFETTLISANIDGAYSFGSGSMLLGCIAQTEEVAEMIGLPSSGLYVINVAETSTMNIIVSSLNIDKFNKIDKKYIPFELTNLVDGNGKYSIATTDNESLAIGEYSSAIGYGLMAYGTASHAEGYGSIGVGSVTISGDANATTYTLSEANSSIQVGKILLYDDVYAKIIAYSPDDLTITLDKTLSLEALSEVRVNRLEYGTTVSGDYSHAEGRGILVFSDYQHVQGKYNIEDAADTYSHIVGNGTSSSARSNAHTLDWSGNAWFAGDVYVGSTSGTNKDEGSVKLQKSIAGIVGQVVGFDDNGNAVAQDKPAYTAEEVGALPTSGGTITGELYIDSGITLSNTGLGGAPYRIFADNPQYVSSYSENGASMMPMYTQANTKSLRVNGVVYADGLVAMNKKISGVGDPSQGCDATNKMYVDKAVSAKADKPSMTRITLSPTSWDATALTQSVAVTGISADETTQIIQCSPYGASMSAAVENGIYCSGQAADTLTFTCTSVPTEKVQFVVSWQDCAWIEPPAELINFTIKYITGETIEYQAEEGMTWKEWIYSDYNTFGVTTEGSTEDGYYTDEYDGVYGVVGGLEVYVACDEIEYMDANTVITSGTKYYNMVGY